MFQSNHFLVFYRFWKSSKRWFCRQIRLVKYSYTFGKCSKSVFWECFYKKHENIKLCYFMKKLFFAWINAARKLLYVNILLGFSLFVKYFLFFASKKVFSLRKKLEYADKMSSYRRKTGSHMGPKNVRSKNVCKLPFHVWFCLKSQCWMVVLQNPSIESVLDHGTVRQQADFREFAKNLLLCHSHEHARVPDLKAKTQNIVVLC